MDNSGKFILNSVAYMDPALLANEPELTGTKWVEYRKLTPFACDVLFAQIYRDCYKDMIKIHVDYRLAEHVDGIDLALWSNTSSHDKAGVRRSVHGARQRADELGLPYQDFIRFCMDFGANRGCKNILQPNQLIPKNPETLSEKQKPFLAKRERIWVKFWDDLEKFRLEILEMKSRRYKAENPDPPQVIPGCLGVTRIGSFPAPPCSVCVYRDRCQRVFNIVDTQVDTLTAANHPTWRRITGLRPGPSRSS